MAIKKDREYRAMSFEVRKSEGKEAPDYIVEGYASTFEPYELFADEERSYCERIEPSAFDDADFSDVIFLYNHEGMVYARNKNGTLDINIDEKGLHTVADLSRTEQSRQMFEQIDSGLVDQMSFAFTVAEDDVVKDKGCWTRVIKRIDKVFDVSAVSIPANPGTDISAVSARDYFNGVIEMDKAERLEQERQLEERRKKLNLLMKLGGL